MNINISDIVKVEGASLDVEFVEKLTDLDSVVGDFTFDNPVHFKGRLVNIGGVMKLDGHLKADYSSKCYRCLDDVNGEIDISIKEDFVDREKSSDTETYTYEGNYVSLDKTLKDNIVLNLPMKQVCTDECKGFCPKCGIDMNTKSCECKEEDINPKMEILKNFFNN
ncbi:MAG: DUF177 domain-containing protein [Clostridia bacterium]|nr:DUF177 domain-containing protein [Clostridia bacterium]